MYTPAQIQLKTVKMVEIEPESAAPRPGGKRSQRLTVLMLLICSVRLAGT